MYTGVYEHSYFSQNVVVFVHEFCHDYNLHFFYIKSNSFTQETWRKAFFRGVSAGSSCIH